MKLNLLNDARVRAAKPEVRLAKTSRGKEANLAGDEPRPRLTKLSDGGGLQLWITPEGAKYWRMAYRFGGKQKLLAFGPYPLVGLSEARASRDEAAKLLRRGIDPAQEKRTERAARAEREANTFAVIAAELLDRKRIEGRSPATLAKVEWLIGLARPTLGERPIAEITSAEALATLRQVDQRGRFVTANRLRGMLGEVFRLAVATGRAPGDPTVALRGALTTTPVKHQSAIIEPKAFGGLLRAIDGYRGAPETRLALMLLSLTFVRANELRGARWEEVDLEARIWTIPARRTKMRREHRVPLSDQAVAIVRELQTLARGPYLFAGGRTADRPISGNALIAALRRMDFGKDEMTAHGFRSSASSMLNELKLWHADAIERQLGHVEGNSIRRAYARSDFWEERVQMMQWWADRCDEMRANAGVARAA